MSDLLLRDVTPELFERLHVLASHSGRPIEAVAAELLRQAVGLTPRSPTDLSRLEEVLQDTESQLLVEAIAAMEGLPDDSFVTTDRI